MSAPAFILLKTGGQTVMISTSQIESVDASPVEGGCRIFGKGASEPIYVEDSFSDLVHALGAIAPVPS